MVGRMFVVLYLLTEVWACALAAPRLLQPHPDPRDHHHMTHAKVGGRGGRSGPLAAGGSLSSIQEAVLRLDQQLGRPNDYNTLMYESGEEDDQLSRLLYQAQEDSLNGNTDPAGVTLLRSARMTKDYDDNAEEEGTSRRKRMARRGSRERRRSKEKRCKPKRGRSRERRPGPRSRERRPGPRSRERRPGPRSKENRPRPSRERCEEETTATNSTTTSTTSSTTTPSTTTPTTTTPSTTTTTTTTPSTTDPTTTITTSSTTDTNTDTP
ncbi:uncharacterized protein [Panulirus ornatus]|uniref:uncharacterized protein isoform X2 n=1 Tax=Panulirus ornatus TaxID=150431 RepID=UPI003A841CCF